MVFQGDMRFIHFPYCLRRLEDGRYIPVNRRYKPLGVTSHERVIYEDHPGAMHVRGLTDELALELDVHKGARPGHIYLYEGNSTPLNSDKAMDEYLQRLKKLAELKMYATA